MEKWLFFVFRNKDGSKINPIKFNFTISELLLKKMKFILIYIKKMQSESKEEEEEEILV